MQSLAAGLAMLPFAAGFESVHDVTPSVSLMAAFAYSVLFVSVFAYLLWFRILTVSGATAASSYHFLIPPLGMLFGWLLLGEHSRDRRSHRHRAGGARHLARHASHRGARLKAGVQSRLNTTLANQPMKSAISAVANP